MNIDYMGRASETKQISLAVMACIGSKKKRGRASYPCDVVLTPIYFAIFRVTIGKATLMDNNALKANAVLFTFKRISWR